MKQMRKILSFVCALCLMTTFLVFPIQGAGETEPSVRIAHHNLAFGNQVYILYAVDVENTEGELQPFMQFWTKEQNDYTNASPDRVSDVSVYAPLKSGESKNYYIFAYTDLTAKQMSDTVYARAGVTVGGNTYYSEVDSYSICEYAARKLGVVDGVSATTDLKLQSMLRSMLDYGTDAQLYFGYHTERLANQHYLTFRNNGMPTKGIQYKVQSDGTATVTGYDVEDTAVVIPTTDPENGALVTAIGANAFSGEQITKISIPNTVTVIGASAFEGCKSLTAIDLPNGLKTLGEKAFYGCRNLVQISLPVTLEHLGINVFPEAEKLVISYQGTRAQFEALLENSTGWNSGGYSFTVSFPDGTRKPYS